MWLAWAQVAPGEGTFLGPGPALPPGEQLTWPSLSPGNAALELLGGLVIDGDGHPGVCVEGELDVVVDLGLAGLVSGALYLFCTPRWPEVTDSAPGAEHWCPSSLILS